MTNVFIHFHKLYRYMSGRSHFGDDERMMRRDGDWDDMPRGRYGY